MGVCQRERDNGGRYAMAHNFFMFASNVIFSGNNTLYESVVLLGCLPSALSFFLSKFIADQKKATKNTRKMRMDMSM